MNRPIGVTLLALGAGLAALFQIWRILVFLGIAKFTFIGNEVSFQSPQWGQAFWALIMAAIWLYVAAGFWGMRGYAWSFGIFIALFTMIFGFFAILGGSATTESELVGWTLSIAIFFYLNYPGVRDQFINAEMSRLTPEQREAVEAAARANEAAARAMTAPLATPPTTPPPSNPASPAG